MKSLIVLWNMLADESASRCHTSATMDKKTVQGRSKHEGLSFLTITLASFGKDFQKSLDQGIVAHDMFGGFTRHGGLPRFLGGFLERVFDRGTGVLLDEPCIDAILAIRQLTLAFSKILLPCTDAREKEAMHAYVKCEQEVRESDRNVTESDLSDFSRIARILYADLFSELDYKVWNGELIPKHGPGATADKLIGNDKYRLRTWTERLERYFSSSEYLFPSPSYYWEEIDAVRFLEPGSEMPVKVITVPKTQKAPRIIAIEPTAMQYAQQAVLEPMVEGIEKHRYLSSFIGFTDQGPNQILARIGPSKGLATLDLSEASDRVSNQLIRTMLHHHPHLHGAVDACRSRKARVPGHGVIRLAKFASMGSALCFPFEAMAFLVMIFLGIERDLNTPLSRDILNEYRGKVRVYGDDIIIPDRHVFSVIHALESFGTRVNMAKSFWTGKFRESCGKEYYDGHDVSIVKVRRVFPHSRRDVPEVISLVSLRNQLYKAGYWQTVRWLDSRIMKVLKYFPRVESTSSVLGRHSFLGYESQKESKELHCPLVRGYVVSPRIPFRPLDGPGALLKYHIKRGSEPVHDVRHLERSGRPHAVNIKLRWAKPY